MSTSQASELLLSFDSNILQSVSITCGEFISVHNLTMYLGHEMIGGILSGIHPDDIISLNQLHGDRRGVVRVTMTSEKAAKKLDQKVSENNVFM